MDDGGDDTLIIETASDWKRLPAAKKIATVQIQRGANRDSIVEIVFKNAVEIGINATSRAIEHRFYQRCGFF